MEQRYIVLRKHLNELGYEQPFNTDAVPLLERLLADLVKTTESLFHYKNLAQSAIEERDQLQLGAEPYKCDNAKLIKECNDLHLTFLQFREQNDKLQRDLKSKINCLERENEELHKHIEHLKKSSDRIIKSKLCTSSASNTKSSKFKDTKMGENGASQLQSENKKLKMELLKQSEACDCLKNMLNHREKEIQRMSNLLEGGRPITALNKDCCYKEMNAKFRKMSEENKKLISEKKSLETQLAEVVAKQHEAMKRALQLAERNKDLEKELQDIDQMALAIEDECNTTLKQNVNKVAQVEQELKYCKCKIESYEREISSLKKTKNAQTSDVSSLKEEQENLRQLLDNALEDKKKLTDRINQFTRIEHDLNLEIDRLMQTCTLQKRKLADLEHQVSSKSKEQPISDMDEGRRRKSSASAPFCKPCGKTNKTRRPNGDSLTAKNMQIKDNEEIIERLKGERDYYKQECQRLRQSEPDQTESTLTDLQRKLKERDDEIRKLEKDVQDVTREKHNLVSQLESMKEVKIWSEDIGAGSLKSTMSRIEKERDLARADVRRLEEERDSLRKRLKIDIETYSLEKDRYQKLLTDSDEKMRKLESERRELMTVQGSRRATINSLEEQIESLNTKLRTTQTELDHIRTLYSQIKTLQEQTDRALADTQGQLSQSEMEYTRAQDRIRELERNRSELDKDLAVVKNECCCLKTNLTKLDMERDSLLIEVDNKTERNAALEQELKAKDNKLMTMETTLTELKKQICICTDDATAKEYMLKSSAAELTTMRKELDEASKSKTNATAENRRLQEDLARISVDLRNAHGELDRARREIEDLKSQLQQYVFEVKRAEDLISKKENERAEMLDQFRSLSQEATILESSNHSLETKALETKNQLTTAMDHISELQNKLEQANILNRDYETEISKLTCQIACLESQVKQYLNVSNKTESELCAVKELCVKLDGQKDTLRKEIQDRDEYKSILEHERDKLKMEVNKIKESLDREQTNIGSMENLLAASRQETVEQRLLNQELQNEIQRLKGLVDELQSKLESTTQQLDVFQERALDYNQQLKQLRREIANERFHSHSGDLSSRYPSL